MANYGYTEDQNPQSSFLRFGLNQGIVYLEKATYNPQGDSNENIEFHFKFREDDSPLYYRLFPITSVKDKNGNEITDPNNPIFASAVSEFNKNISHIMSAFRTDEELKQLFSVPINSFADFGRVVEKAIPENAKDIDIDVFAQYQYNITGENKKTFLRLPNKIKHGLWICKSMPGTWSEVRDGGGLKYINENQQFHVFKRSKWFMESNFAKQQELVNPLAATNSTSTEENVWK